MGYPVPAGVSAAIAAYLLVSLVQIGAGENGDIGDSRLVGLPSGCGDRIWGRYRQRWWAMRWWWFAWFCLLRWWTVRETLQF